MPAPKETLEKTSAPADAKAPPKKNWSKTKKTDSVPKAKIGPTTALVNQEWSANKSLKDSFVVLLGAPSGVRQYTFHRPIGVSGIENPDSQWVATFSTEVEYLVKNSLPASVAIWRRKAQQALEDQLLGKPGNGRFRKEGTIIWEKGPVCATEIPKFEAAALAAHKLKSDWMDFAPESVKIQEQTWRLRKKESKVSNGWLQANPAPTDLTLGGPLGTVPQSAVPYLKGLTASAAQDRVLKTALGIP